MTWSRYSGVVLAAAAACTPVSSGKGPVDLVASEVTDRSVTLTWKDSAIGETRFSVERSELSETSGFNEVGTVAAGGTTFHDLSIQPSKIYFYRVTALYPDASRISSSAIKVTTQIAAVIPVAPSGLTAAATSMSDIHLGWTDNSSNETGFEVERGAAQAGPFTLVTTTAANAVTYVDPGLTKSTTYWYRVRSTNTAGGSPYTISVSATTYITNDNIPPSVPMGVVATPASISSIIVSWTASTDNSSGVASYSVQRNATEVGTVTAPGLSYTATLLGAGTMYCYTVIAVDAVGNRSAPSSPAACATTPLTQTGPNPPFNLTATTGSYQLINLRWSDGANDENGFEVERSLTTANGFAKIATLGPANGDGGVSFGDDGGIAPSTAYYYRVRAFNDGGNSTYSNESSAATLPTPPAAPTNLTLTVLGSNTLRLNWVDNSVNEDGFSVDQSLMPDAGFLAITQTAANAVSFTPTGLSPSTAYFFRIRAYNLGGNSATIGPVTGTTASAPNPPTAADAGPIGQTTMTINWVDNSADEYGFRVERATNANGPYTQVLKADAGAPAADQDVTQYQAVGLTANTVYFFRVRSVGDAGFSNPSQCTARTTP